MTASSPTSPPRRHFPRLSPVPGCLPLSGDSPSWSYPPFGRSPGVGTASLDLDWPIHRKLFQRPLAAGESVSQSGSHPPSQEPPHSVALGRVACPVIGQDRYRVRHGTPKPKANALRIPKCPAAWRTGGHRRRDGIAEDDDTAASFHVALFRVAATCFRNPAALHYPRHLRPRETVGTRVPFSPSVVLAAVFTLLPKYRRPCSLWIDGFFDHPISTGVPWAQFIRRPTAPEATSSAPIFLNPGTLLASPLRDVLLPAKPSILPCLGQDDPHTAFCDALFGQRPISRGTVQGHTEA